MQHLSWLLFLIPNTVPNNLFLPTIYWPHFDPIAAKAMHLGLGIKSAWTRQKKLSTLDQVGWAFEGQFYNFILQWTKRVISWVENIFEESENSIYLVWFLKEWKTVFLRLEITLPKSQGCKDCKHFPFVRERSHISSRFNPVIPSILSLPLPFSFQFTIVSFPKSCFPSN